MFGNPDNTKDLQRRAVTSIIQTNTRPEVLRRTIHIGEVALASNKLPRPCPVSEFVEHYYNEERNHATAELDPNSPRNISTNCTSDTITNTGLTWAMTRALERLPIVERDNLPSTEFSESSPKTLRARLLCCITLPALIVIPLMSVDAYVASNSPFGPFFESSAMPSLLLVCSLVPALKLDEWLGESGLVGYGTASFVSAMAMLVQIVALVMSALVSKR